jgi:UDP:flavonoid glycosyltransferase YjiC (YdhE family)
MRFLFVVPPLVGHVNPAAAVARTLLERGHEVVFVGHAAEIGHLLPEGASLRSLGELPADVSASIVERSQGLRGLESVQFLWQDFIVPLCRATRREVLAIAREVRPDVLVSDQQMLSGAFAARALHLRWATLASTSAGVTDPLAAFPKVRAWRNDLVGRLEAEADLMPVEAPDLSRRLVLCFSTRELIGDKAIPAQVRLVGPALAPRRETPEFPWDRLQDKRRVLVSPGTVSADRGAPFYRAVVEAFAAAQDLQLILAAPPELVGSVPDHFLVRPRVPQLELLREVHAVVSHGGQNTVCESLAASLPLVVAPIRDDQPVIAQQVVDAGAGLRLRFGRVTPAALAAAVRRVLDEPGFRDAAARLAASFEAAGGVAEAARALEELGAAPLHVGAEISAPFYAGAEASAPVLR